MRTRRNDIYHSASDTIGKGGGKDEKTEVQMKNNWLTVRLTPKEYACMIGHSEKFVRNYCMPAKLRNDPDALIEMQIATHDILANCFKLSAVRSDTKGV